MRGTGVAPYPPSLPPSHPKTFPNYSCVWKKGTNNTHPAPPPPPLWKRSSPTSFKCICKFFLPLSIFLTPHPLSIPTICVSVYSLSFWLYEKFGPENANLKIGPALKSPIPARVKEKESLYVLHTHTHTHSRTRTVLQTNKRGAKLRWRIFYVCSNKAFFLSKEQQWKFYGICR